MLGTLVDLIGDVADRPPPPVAVPLCLFAEGGRDADPTARAAVCPADPGGSFACPLDPTLTYVLNARRAADCVAVLEEWWATRATPLIRYAAVMYYVRAGEWILPHGLGGDHT